MCNSSPIQSVYTNAKPSQSPYAPCFVQQMKKRGQKESKKCQKERSDITSDCGDCERYIISTEILTFVAVAIGRTSEP